MKKIYNTIAIVSTTLLVNACSSAPSVSPSQNKAVNNITSVKEVKEDGAMQRSLDNWLTKEWTPTVEKDEKIKKINEDKGRSFTLQEYVDKAVAYSKESNSSTEKSHADEMSSMPAIGTKK